MKRSVVSMVIFVLGMAGMASADWESDANACIEQNRKRNATITVVDLDGAPVEGVTVSLKQVTHRFGFGSAIESTNSSEYYQYFRDLFEWAVPENKLKWAHDEPSQGTYNYTGADSLVEFCVDRDIKVRGHTVLWDASIPTWAQSLNNTDLQAAMSSRIDSVVNRYEGKIEHWDVHNEMLDDIFFVPKFGESINAWMFQRVRDEDPNVKLFLNEYTTEPSGDPVYDAYATLRANSYISKIQSLLDAGADVGGIGLQCHIESIDPSAFKSRLDEYAAFGIPIWLTEFDCDASSAAARADTMEDTFRVAFSHSSVDGIMLWGFWAGNMIGNSESALYDANWNLTTMGQRYLDLMDEWTTELDDVTDASGELSFRGFHGGYEVSIIKDGVNLGTQTIELDPGTGEATYTLSTPIKFSTPIVADDFEDGVIDSELWNLSSNEGSVTESDGQLTLTSAGLQELAEVYGKTVVCPWDGGTVTLQSTGANLGKYMKGNLWGFRGALDGEATSLTLTVDDDGGNLFVTMCQDGQAEQMLMIGVTTNLNKSIPFVINWSLDRVVVAQDGNIVFDTNTDTVDQDDEPWRIPTKPMVIWARSGYYSNTLIFDDMELRGDGDVQVYSDAFSDDFEDSSLASSLWDTTMNNGTIVESGGELTMSSNDSSNRAFLISTSSFQPDDGIVILKSSHIDFGYYLKDNFWGLSTVDGQNYIRLRTDKSSGCLYVHMKKDGGTYQHTADYVVRGNLQSGAFSIMWQTDRVRAWKGDTLIFDSETMPAYNGSETTPVAWKIPVVPLSIYAMTGYNSSSIIMEDVEVLVADEAPQTLLPGDANNDGMVDVGDLGILAANYGTATGAGWSEGDFNDDGAVDVGDLGILAANYGTGSSSSMNFDADYAKVFGSADVEESNEAEDDEAADTLCSTLGLPLIAGLAIMGLMLVKLEE